MARRSLERVLTDHEEIRQWAEERGARPARVKGTGGDGDVGIIRLDFPGYTGEDSLEPISWDDWFRKFDESNLALIVQDVTATGERSNFNKLVSRETLALAQHGERQRSAAQSRSSRAGSSSRKTTARRATARSSRSASSRTSARGSGTRGSGTRSSGKRRTAAKSRTRSSASSRRKSAARASSRRQSSRSQGSRKKAA